MDTGKRHKNYTGRLNIRPNGIQSPLRAPRRRTWVIGPMARAQEPAEQRRLLQGAPATVHPHQEGNQENDDLELDPAR